MIYYCRHGETLFNRAGRVQGRQDSPLSLRGIEQIRDVAAILARELADIERVPMICSPLGRARQSMGILCDMLDRDYREVIVEPRLAELAFGIWEGLSLAEIEAFMPDAWAARSADYWNYAIDGGESMAMLAERVGGWLAEQSFEREIVVVGHGAVGRMLRALQLDLTAREMRRLPEPQGQVHRFQADRIETIGIHGTADIAFKPGPPN